MSNDASERDGTPQAGGIIHLPDDTIGDILLRLPTSSVLRSGAVCKSWRRVTTDPLFLDAHYARRRTSSVSVILHTTVDGAPWPGRGNNLLPPRRYGDEDVALDAFPISSDVAFRVIRHPKKNSCYVAHCRLLASCNGVLLFLIKDKGHYLLCNPVTRQWAQLPRLPDEYLKTAGGDNIEYAFYFHDPSAQFRLLCRLDRGDISWFIMSTGAAARPLRQLNMSADDDKVGRSLYSLYGTETTPVALHGNLHWPPHQRFGAVETGVVAFDMTSETFHRKPGPSTTRSSWIQMKLFEMGGQLVVADFRKEQMQIDLWFLEDYGAARWEHRHRVASPWEEGVEWPDLRSVAAAGDDEEGNVILGDRRGLVVYDTGRSRTVRRLDVDSLDSTGARVHVTRHVFKGSLEQHACFTHSSADVPLVHSFDGFSHLYTPDEIRGFIS